MWKRLLSLMGVTTGTESTGARRRTSARRCERDDVAFFANLNCDCKVYILSYLSADDLNSFAMCSRDCRQVRNDESLDQTRAATILWTKKTTPNSFYRKIQETRHVFGGNRTRLKVVCPENLIERRIRYMDYLPSVVEPLEEVTSLECLGYSYQVVPWTMLAHILPNLQMIDGVFSTFLKHSIGIFVKHCPALTKITCNNGSKRISFTGSEFQGANSPTHLYLDSPVSSKYSCMFDNDCAFFRFGARVDVRQYLASDRFDCYLLMKCSRLECLSIKGATLMAYGNDPLPQGVLVNMVRRHPTLRWLRSDLTAENIAMLKQERPEITFVTDWHLAM